ncbi:unnamed protein product [Cuscuta campestris]|uniref:EamA domain-containing protein n=1 Tax=Cuscuta campestris TaxID=132261 RepID=A0A484N5W8_9ASTE|nr:unnamed protein product [Cuscuta campestris]
MKEQTWKWVLGLVYILLVASIWIVASFVVQTVVDAGVSPFLVTYICNSLFVVYIPLVEIGRYLEDNYGSILFWKARTDCGLQELRESEEVILLEDGCEADASSRSIVAEGKEANETVVLREDLIHERSDTGVDAKGRWTRTRVAKVSLLICPFWFLAQLMFNLSLKYTTVTSNTILSTASSLFTFLVSVVFLGENFTWVKLLSVLLCMGGTIIVSLGDSKSAASVASSNAIVGDILALLSSALYAVYITLIRKKLSDDDDDDKTSGRVSMAQFLGYLGLFNLLIFLPVFLILNITKLELFTIITWKQLGLIAGKGLLDNVLSDYLWAKAILLTSTTVATAGLTIQVPLAAIVDSLTGNSPGIMDYIGATAVMMGFAGINIPSGACSKSQETNIELEEGNLHPTQQEHVTPQ